MAAVKGLIHRTIDVCYLDVYPEEAVKFFRNWHCDDRILKDVEEGHTIVLEKENRIIGTGTIVENHIKTLFIEPALQSRGLGRLIMHELEQKAVALGVDVVVLDASIPSKKFYDSLDYVTMEEAHLNMENNERLDFYKMQKALVKQKPSS